MSPAAHGRILFAVVLACLLSAGCREGKLNLRGAEDLSLAWLHNLEGFLASPAARAQETRNAEAPGGTVGDGEAQNEETADEPDPNKPRCLRDCFVDDGWLPEGFRNPTAAIAWLTTVPRTLGQVQSIDLAEGGAQVTFELKGNPPTVLTALIVREGSLPKCKRLQQAQATDATETEGSAAEGGPPRPQPSELKPAPPRKTPSAPAKAPKTGQTQKQAAGANP